MYYEYDPDYKVLMFCRTCEAIGSDTNMIQGHYGCYVEHGGLK